MMFGGVLAAGFMLHWSLSRRIQLLGRMDRVQLWFHFADSPASLEMGEAGISGLSA